LEAANIKSFLKRPLQSGKNLKGSGLSRFARYPKLFISSVARNDFS